MTHNLIVSSEEYLLLRDMAKLAPYAKPVDEEDNEIVDLLIEYGNRYQKFFWDRVPLPTSEPLENQYSNSSADLIANAMRVANGLMSTGMNGPRLGSLPVGPCNLMCEASATIMALLEERK